MEATNSTGNGHVGNQHWQGANDGISHSVFSVEWRIESPVVGSESDQIIRSIGKSVIIIIVTQSNTDPETSDDKVILDGEDDN